MHNFLDIQCQWIPSWEEHKLTNYPKPTPRVARRKHEWRKQSDAPTSDEKKAVTENETIENGNIGHRRLVLAEVLNDKVGEEKKKNKFKLVRIKRERKNYFVHFVELNELKKPWKKFAAQVIIPKMSVTIMYQLPAFWLERMFSLLVAQGS